MTISPDRLILTNGGELTPALFGPLETEKSLIDKLEHWVAEGILRATSLSVVDADAYAESYAYVKAYTAAIVVRAGDASSSRLATGESEDFSDAQLEALKEERARHEGLLVALLPDDSAVPILAPRDSYSAPIRFGW